MGGTPIVVENSVMDLSSAMPSSPFLNFCIFSSQGTLCHLEWCHTFGEWILILLKMALSHQAQMISFQEKQRNAQEEKPSFQNWTRRRFDSGTTLSWEAETTEPDEHDRHDHHVDNHSWATGERWCYESHPWGKAHLRFLRFIYCIHLKKYFVGKFVRMYTNKMKSHVWQKNPPSNFNQSKNFNKIPNFSNSNNSCLDTHRLMVVMI